MLDLNPIKKRLSFATKGSWFVKSNMFEEDEFNRVLIVDESLKDVAIVYKPGDASFIFSARQDVAALLKEVEELRSIVYATDTQDKYTVSDKAENKLWSS